MPLPIKPLYLQEQEGSTLFDNFAAGDTLSSMQQYFLGDAPKKTASKHLAANTVEMLEEIYNTPSDEITLANSVFAKRNGQDAEVFRVPKTISDYELIGLKTSGLVNGSGRAVTFSQAARIALRDKWLAGENAFKKAKTKEQFIHPANPKFQRHAQIEEEIIEPQDHMGEPMHRPSDPMEDWINTEFSPEEAKYGHEYYKQLLNGDEDGIPQNVPNDGIEQNVANDGISQNATLLPEQQEFVRSLLHHRMSQVQKQKIFAKKDKKHFKNGG